jgi:hypothetical protein
MSSLRRAVALLVFATVPLTSPAVEAQVPRAEISHPCAWLNPMTKGYAFCLEQHLQRMRELAAESEVKLPVASTAPETHRSPTTRSHKAKPKNALHNRDG